MKKTAILCIHGFTGCPSEFKILRDLFTKLGYDSYTFVLSGHQGKKLKGATRQDWEKDCIENIELLKSKGYKKVILVGHSMGGVLASIMALKYEDYIEKIILIDPAFEYLRMKDGKVQILPSLKQSVQVLKEVNGLKKIHYSPVVGCSISSMKEFCLLVKEHAKDIEKVKCPLLFLHGEKDCIVPIEKLKATYEKIDNKNKKFIEVKKGTHWFLSSKQNDEIYERISNFILNDN